jgi:ribosomal protein S18 acetylase RimI-like enzyme
VWVADGPGGVEAVLELLPARDHLLVENVAVDPACQGRGLGRRMMGFAEAEARRRGLPEVRLYTDERFADNVTFYARLGYHVFERASNGAAPLVFMAKRVAASSPSPAGGGGGVNNTTPSRPGPWSRRRRPC